MLKIIVKVFLIMFLFTKLVFAGNHFENVINENVYIGIGLINSTLTVNEAALSSKYANGNDVFMGEEPGNIEIILGYKRDRHLNLEMGFAGLGVINTKVGEQTITVAEVETFFVNASLSTRLSEKFKFYGKLGVSSWDVYSGSDRAKSIDSGSGLLYGLGFDINLYDGDDQQLRLEWKHHDFDGLLLQQADQISVSMLINFK